MTDVFDLVIIELKKAEKLLKQGKLNAERNLEDWLKFFIKPYEIMEGQNMEDFDEQLKNAYEELQKVNANEEEREFAEERYRNLLRIKHMKEYEFNAGHEEGKKEKQIEIARKMKLKGLSVEEIKELTEISEEEIENL